MSIPNQIFLGMPWKNVRKRYERLIDRFKVLSPLSFVIVGRGDDQDAEDLLEVIKGKLDESSYAIFDATGGNANVSLEYGYAEAKNIPRVLYMSTHKAAHKGKDAAILSDLAGKMRKHYANEGALRALLSQFSGAHAYTKRFQKALTKEFRRKDKGTKKRLRALALKVIHSLDGQSDGRRDDLVQNLRADQANYKTTEIEEVIRRLHKNNLIVVEAGRYSKVSIA